MSIYPRTMDQNALEIIFTLLIGAGIVATLCVLKFSSAHFRREFRSVAMALASLVAIGATLGSLYFSEVRDFLPCEWCWYQRIAMYPLAVLLPIATLRRDKRIIPYALTLTTIGAGFSIYHYQLQAFPDQGTSCTLSASCTYRWVEVFGFVSIPMLALGSFTLIGILLLATGRPWKG